MSNYIERHGKGWRFCLRIPPEYQAFENNRKVIKKSLKTADKREASRLAKGVYNSIQKRWHDFATKQDQPLDYEELDMHIKQYLFDLQAKDKKNRRDFSGMVPKWLLPYTSSGMHSNEELACLHWVDEYQRMLKDPWYPSLDPQEFHDPYVAFAYLTSEIEGFKKRFGYVTPAESSKEFTIGQEVTKAHIQLERLRAARAKGDLAQEQFIFNALFPSGAPQDANVSTASTCSSLVESGAPLLKLSEVFDRWKEEHLRYNRAPKTVTDFKSQVSRFIEYHGDMPIAEVTRRHVFEFRDAMLDHPACLTKAMRELSIRERIEVAKSDPSVKKVSPRTVNEKCVAALSAVFGYAERELLIESNPAHNAKKRVQATHRSRQAYTDEDLKCIFESFPVYTEGYRPKVSLGEAAFWLPLLGLFTGARLEELGQLLVDDVRQSSDVWYLDLMGRNDTPEGKKQRFKNVASHREVPVHSKLIKIGFLEFVNEQKAAGHVWLFHELPENTDKRTDRFSKWWNRYSRQHGGFDSSKVFHSFRHTVKNAFRRAESDMRIADRLQGHSLGTEGSKYGDDVPVNISQKTIELLRYDVDFSPLYRN
ncbi:site-specific integrase [Halodesulfovibrio spirochaetisodalis]|uniref:Tyr recombinase domain-containing protein n=1 Tax=Halodesulfovibrio spirochaetisodalis TaxID=1560234 RepID=A0A1B7XMP5_9BACT|nr:site-specific integrase [Halodesulfovibrio spirochaetisodalis]OBQ56782.1 hypothetical protein SP90_01515 [Halodesulfovibrio spirochaetisodalis]